MRRRLPAGGWWLAALLLATLAATSAAAAPPAEPGLFDQLFGTDPAAERAGKASDGLALPGLFAQGQRLADALPLYDLGPGQNACVAAVPLLDALELRHNTGDDGSITVTLPEPRRTIVVPAAALLASPSGPCLPLATLPGLLPLAINHDPVSQRLMVEARAPLPVLMRLARAERQARLHPEVLRPAFALVPRPSALARLWSLDLAAGLVQAATGSDVSASVQASGELFGLSVRAGLGLSGRAAPTAGFTLSDARETPDLLGPMGARSLAIGDIASPAQPLIADALSGRGLVVSSRPPWRADLVDEIDLFGPLPAGWEAELWHEDRLVDATRDADAAGQWRFARLPVRLGENRWVVRLYGPHGESNEQAFTRLIGTEMNAENEVDYSIGFVEGGTPLLGAAPQRTASGAAAFATLGWGLAPALTARFGLSAPLAGNPALSLGMHGAHGGTLWAATLARDGKGGLGSALRLARRVGATDLLLDLARHGRDAGPAQAPPVREFAGLASLSGTGRLALGRSSLPWQLRLQSAARRGGGHQQAIGGRLALPLATLQANAGLGLIRQGVAGWQGGATLGMAATHGPWRLRGGLDAVLAGGWRLGGGNVSAVRRTGSGTISLDMGWQTDRRRLSGGLAWNQRLGAFGLSAGLSRAADGWRLGLGLVVGLWQGAGRWHAAPAGLTRSGAVLANLFIDDDGDNQRDAGEAAMPNGRFIVGNSLRSETTGGDGHVLLRGLPTGLPVDVETQLASLPDFSLRPARPGDRLRLRPGEVRTLAIPLQPTGSVEAQILLVTGTARTPRSGVPVTLHDARGNPVVRGVTDFEGYVLFEGLPFGRFSVEAAGQTSTDIALSRDEPNRQISVLLPPPTN